MKSSVYTGLNAVVLKQMVSWCSYLYWDARCRGWMKQDQSEKLSGKQIVVCSLATGVLNILTGSSGWLIHDFSCSLRHSQDLASDEWE